MDSPVGIPRTPAVDATQRMRVLLVEDDDGDALLVEEELELSGARVDLERVRTLADAAAAAPGAYDCVLLDLNLPDAQGLDALRELRGLAPDLAVLVLTGLDDERRGVEAVAAGAQDYLRQGRDQRRAARPLAPLRGRAPARRADPAAALHRPARGARERASGARPAAGAARQRPGARAGHPTTGPAAGARCSAATSSTRSRRRTGPSTR